MQARSPRWLVVAFAVGLALARDASPPRALAGKPPPPATLMGTVVREGTSAPVPYATVVVRPYRQGTTTDEQGRFLIPDVPAGRVEIVVRSLGDPALTEALTLVPGDTVRRVYRLPEPPQERRLRIRDSLTTRGLWPPTLEPALLAHMREALDVRVFRLDPGNPDVDAHPDREKRIGPWPILREAPAPDRAAVDTLVEVLRSSELYMPRIEGDVKVCGGFEPGIDVRFTSLGVPVDLLLCFKCGEFAIWRDGQSRQGGDFVRHGPVFARFAKRAFPKDPAFKKLGERAR